MTVIVYTKPNCPHCNQAKQLLEQKDVSYTSLEIGKDCTREDVMAQFPNVRSVPIITIDNEFIGGYNELKQYFETAE